MARALASIINVIDPEVIVLGGGLSNIDRLYDERADAVGAAHLLRSRDHAPGSRERTATPSGVRGAAWLWERKSGAVVLGAGVLVARVLGARSAGCWVLGRWVLSAGC